MERFEARGREDVEVTQNQLLKEMGLVDAEGKDQQRYQLDLASSTTAESAEVRRESRENINPESLFRCFPEAVLASPESLRRPAGDTTLFTTAGIQRIETMLRDEGELKKQVLAVAQPVIRSQYMDKVGSGTSTSFVDFSVVSIRATSSEFFGLCKKGMDLLISHGVRPEDIRFTVEKTPDRWGSREFSKTVLTYYVDGIEVGEGVFMHDYPVNESEKVTIADICFGVERLNWVLRGGKDFFPGFQSFYENVADTDRLTSVIDCARTATLMLGEGVKPSHHDPGYRIRQLSKRFVTRNKEFGIDAGSLVRAADVYWKTWGHQAKASSDEIAAVLVSENERSANVLILSGLARRVGKNITMEVNQPTASFVQQAKRSLPKDILEAFEHVIADAI